MNILIKETGELRSLSFIDWHDGQKYTEQLISASGEDCNFLFDQDGEVFMTDAPTFSKWNAFFRSHCDVDSACSALGLKPISKAEYDPFVPYTSEIFIGCLSRLGSDPSFFVLKTGNKLLLKLSWRAKPKSSECTIEGRTIFLV